MSDPPAPSPSPTPPTPAEEHEYEAIELEGRLLIGITSFLMLGAIIFGSVYYKAHTGPSFVKSQLLLLFLCNLGGLVLSCSMVKRNFYDSGWTFTWQSFWITLYYGGNLLSGWFFAYRYLVTSRSI